MTPRERLDGPTAFRSILQRWWLVVGLAIVGAAAGYIFGKSRPLEYSASQDIIVSAQTPNPFLVALTNTSEDPARLVQTQDEILSGPTVRNALKSRYGNGQVALSIGSSATSNIISVTTTAKRRAEAVASLGTAIRSYEQILGAQQRSELGQVQQSLDASIAKVSAAALRGPARSRSLAQQQLLTLQTDLEQLKASEATGLGVSQRVGRAAVEGPNRSPSLSETLIIGIAFGGWLAAMIAIFLLKPKAPPAPDRAPFRSRPES